MASRIMFKGLDVDAKVAAHLAERLNNSVRDIISLRVARRLLVAFPELTETLRPEVTTSPEERLSKVSTERLFELVRAILMFDMLSLADQELYWAHGVLSRSGVTYEHQSTMVRWFFEEVRRLDLELAELAVTRELEYYMLGVIATIFQLNGQG